LTARAAEGSRIGSETVAYREYSGSGQLHLAGTPSNALVHSLLAQLDYFPTVAFTDRAACSRDGDELKKQQLAKCGARLAAIVNKIWP
jgi:hypothetical protein